MGYNFIKRNMKIVSLVFVLLFLNSCHSKYISIRNEVCRGPVWNNSKTAMAFAALQKVSRAPVGVAKFPDGGQSKAVYSIFGIYIYDLNSNNLIKLTEVTSRNYLPVRDHIKFKFALTDSFLYYNSASSLDWYGMDNLTKIKYSKDKFYSIDVKTKDLNEIDSSLFFSEYNKNTDSSGVSLKEASNLIADVPYADWGLVLKEIYPQSKQTYFEYIIENKGIFRAIDEQIIPDLSGKDKSYILKKMKDKQQELLNDYETTSKEQDVYQKSLKRREYFRYTSYFELAKKALDAPSLDNQIANRKEVLNRLKKYKIDILDDFELLEVHIIGEGYDAEFQLRDADSLNIEKQKKWFHNELAYLLNNEWEISKQTKFEKPDSAGIVVRNLINFIWEYTELKYISENEVHFLKLEISYDVNNEKELTFSVTEEIEKINK